MWSGKTRLPVRGRRPRTGSLVFQTTSRLEWWFVILYHITGRTPDLKCIFGNHSKPALSKPGGPIVRPQVWNSNTEFPLVWRFWPNWIHMNYFRKVKVTLSKCSTFIRLSWLLAVKVRGCTYCYWDEKFRNQQWKCELWPHSRWTTWICLPTSCGSCQGDLGEGRLYLHLSWHAGDHHWNLHLVRVYIHHPLFQVTTVAIWMLLDLVPMWGCQQMAYVGLAKRHPTSGITGSILSF